MASRAAQEDSLSITPHHSEVFDTGAVPLRAADVSFGGKTIAISCAEGDLPVTAMLLAEGVSCTHVQPSQICDNMTVD
jgi:hypothetical protein